MREINWSEDDVKKIMQMNASGMDAKEIAWVFGKTPKAIYQMLYRRRKRGAIKRKLFRWEASDVEELNRLIELGHSAREIAAAMGRNYDAVTTKICWVKARAKEAARKQAAAPLASIEWRPISQHASTTAMLMGDPLPGRSALDRRANG